jgi:hypothetical protein
MFVFSIQLYDLLSPLPSLWFNFPPRANKSTVYTYTVCKGAGGGVLGSVPQTDKHLPQSPLQFIF